MKHFLKGAAVTAAVLIVLIVINVFCNRNGIQLDSVITGSTSAVCAMWIYQALTRNEKNKEDREGKEKEV